MIFLGFGKYVRADKIYALEPLGEGERGHGARTRVWVDGIACAPYLPSIHLQSYMRERYGFSEGLCPVSEEASARTMAIPFHGRLPREDQERVVEALKAALSAA